MEIWSQVSGRFQSATEVRFLTYTLHYVNLGVVCYICENTFTKIEGLDSYQYPFHDFLSILSNIKYFGIYHMNLENLLSNKNFNNINHEYHIILKR